jgi:hypothetical protein
MSGGTAVKFNLIVSEDFIYTALAEKTGNE